MTPHFSQFNHEITEMISRLKILEMENIKLKEDYEKLSKHLEQRGTEDEVSTVEKVCM